MNLINWGDFLDLFTKIKEKRVGFFLSKLNFHSTKRTKSTFNSTNINSSNFWIIPEIHTRWNEIMTGSREIEYEDYVVKKYLAGKHKLKMLSIGCGIGNHELRFAGYDIFESITGLDLAPELIKKANQNAIKRGLQNIEFLVQNVYNFKVNDNYYDVVLFNDSLHHFKNIDSFLKKIKNSLIKKGILIVHEYVGADRFQYPDKQIDLANSLISGIPPRLRRKHMSKNTKKKIYKPGLFRMIISDPSEAVDSNAINPALHNNFITIEEKKLGGNILMPLLKDISHNFLDKDDQEARNTLEMLFNEENKYLESNSSDFVFGIYTTS